MPIAHQTVSIGSPPNRPPKDGPHQSPLWLQFVHSFPIRQSAVVILIVFFVVTVLEISRNQETSTFTCPRCSNYDTPDPNRLTWHCTTSCTSLFPPLSDFQPPVTVPPPSAFKSPKVVLKSPGAHSDQEPNSVAVPTAASSTSPLPPANGPKETPGSTTPLTVVKQKQKRFYCRLCTPQLSFENAEIKEAHVQAFHADLKKKKRRATTAADAGSGLKNEIGEGEGPGPSAKTRRRTRGSEVGPDALFAGGADSPGLMLPPPSTLSPRTRSGWAASYLPTSQNPYGGYPASMLANRDYPQSSPYNHSLNAPYGDPALHGYSPSLPPPPQPTQSGRRRTMVPTDHRPSCQFCIVFPPVRFDSPQGKEEHEERVHSWPKKRKAFVLSLERTEEGNGEGETMVVEKEETVKADPGECLECIPNVKFGNQTHQAWHWRVCHSKEITVMFGDGEQALISRSTKSGRFDCPGCSHPGSQKTGYRNWDPESLKKHLEVCLPSSSTTVSPPPVLSPSTVPPPPAVPSSNLPTTAISADSALMEGVEPTDHTSPSKTQLPSSLPLETPPLPTVPIPEEPGSAKALGPSHSASKYSLSSLLNN